LYNLYVLRNIADYIYQIKQIKITITGGIVKKKKKKMKKTRLRTWAIDDSRKFYIILLTAYRKHSTN